MRFRTSLCLATLFSFVSPLRLVHTAPRPDWRQIPCNPHPITKSLSGPIASVGDAEFSVQVRKDKDVNTVQFLVDGKTKSSKLPWARKHCRVSLRRRQEHRRSCHRDPRPRNELVLTRYAADTLEAGYRNRNSNGPPTQSPAARFSFLKIGES